MADREVRIEVKVIDEKTGETVYDTYYLTGFRRFTDGIDLAPMIEDAHMWDASMEKLVADELWLLPDIGAGDLHGDRGAGV